jgi:hypothetical protein
MEDRNIVMAAVMAELGRLNDLGASPERFRQHGLWTHRVIVITVAAAILLVFFVPLPGKSMFNRIVAPTKSPTTTTTSPPVTRATQQEIKAFVALANKGLHREFTATYRTVVTGTGDLLLMTVTAAQVSWPLSSDAEVSPHLMYEESVSGSLSEVFLGALRSSRSAPGWYTCHKVLAWTCSPTFRETYFPACKRSPAVSRFQLCSTMRGSPRRWLPDENSSASISGRLERREPSCVRPARASSPTTRLR